MSSFESLNEAVTSWPKFVAEADEEILPFYREHERTFDSFGIHGVLHAGRSVLLAEAMARFLARRDESVPFWAVRTATAFHDSGRQGNGADLWEADSARLCAEHLARRHPECSAEERTNAAALIVKKSETTWTLAKQIVTDADVLEIMRPYTLNGMQGFRRELFGFLREQDRAGDSSATSIRDRLIEEAWRFIELTQQRAQPLRSHPRPLSALYEMAVDSSIRLPWLSAQLGDPTSD
jgi:hypothetical protein